MTTIIGDENGISLWNKMAVSPFPEEISYFNSLSAAAQQYGKIYFYDCVTQAQQRLINQARYCMEWDGNNWNVSLFLLPENAKIISYNPPPPNSTTVRTDDESLWQEIDPNDVIIIVEEPA